MSHPLRIRNSISNQHRIALRNCGIINPENIEEYIGTDGYEALGKVVTSMTPEEVIKVSYRQWTPWPGWRRIPYRNQMETGSFQRIRAKICLL